jgi:hypothetical protein
VRRLRWSQGVLRPAPSSGEQSCRALVWVFGLVGFISGARAHRWLFARQGTSLAEGERFVRERETRYDLVVDW